jgi:glycosyltransferase involved in cell wall biosynthesis
MSNKLDLTAQRLPSPHPALQLIVTIPAKNESEYIIPTLEALSRQELGSKTKACYEVIVLINHSSDATLKKCSDFKQNNPDFNLHILVTYAPEICNVGAARKLMMDLAASRLTDNNHLITMTDADTLVGKNWVAQLLKFIPTPIDFICGAVAVNCNYLNGFARVMFDAKERYLRYRSQLEALLLPEIHDPWPRHAANSGPNMALKKAAYLHIGGMPALECLEDSALHQRAVYYGLKICHTLGIEVETSARLQSRVARGFGDELQFWSALTDESYCYNVEGLKKMQVRLQAYTLVKSAYLTQNRGKIGEIARLLKLPKLAVSSLFKAYPNYRAMNQRLFTVLEKHRPWQAAYPNKSVIEANAELEHFFTEIPSIMPDFSATARVRIPTG